MNWFFLIFGIVLLLAAFVDALWTVFWVDGNAGPLSSRVTTWIWNGTRALVRRGSHDTISLNGPATLTLILLMWVLLLWAGWVFVFAAGEDALLDTRDRTPASWTGRIFFVAYTMFTMGNGDFSPREGAWQIVASLTTGTGMVLITIVVSYVISVLASVVEKRSFASQVTALGIRSEELVLHAWDGRGFPHLELMLDTYASQISGLTEQHLAYPILYYYHAKDESKATAVAVTVLDEALTLLRYGVAPEHRPSPAALRVARQSIQGYLASLKSAFIDPAEKTPPPPDLNRLREAGIPTVSDAEFARALEEERDRRRRLLGMIQNSGWPWPGEGD